MLIAAGLAGVASASQARHTRSVTIPPAEKIALAAADLCLQRGLGSVTMRSVAAAAHVAPSAVVYHFATREKLLLAVLDRLAVQVCAAAEELRDAPDDICTALADAASFVSAVLPPLINAQGQAIVAIDELGLALASGDEADASRARMEQFHRKCRDFWTTLPHVSREDTLAREIWAAVAQGMIPLVMLDRNPISRNVEVIRLAHRLSIRLAGGQAVLVGDEAADDQAGRDDAADISRPKGKQQIVDATIRLSGVLGVDGLTHRKIAAEAGLSVASTTYFYPTKQDMVIDAARELQARAINAVVQAADAKAGILSRIMLDQAGERRADLAALGAFSNAAVRSGGLGELATTFRRLRGATAVHWLRSLGFAEVDRLDGLLWAMATVALGNQAFTLPRHERAPYLDATSHAWLERLFA